MVLILTVIPRALRPRNGLQLPLQQNFRRLEAPIDHLAVPHPAVNPAADLRVHRVHRQGHVGDLELRQFVQIGRQAQAVGGQAQQEVRKPLANQANGLQGLFGVGERVSRAGDARHGDAGLGLQDLFQVGDGLLRLEHRAGDPRAALIDAIVFPVAIIAQDVALGRHRQVHPAAFALDRHIEAWMSISIQHDRISCIESFELVRWGNVIPPALRNIVLLSYI